MLRTRETGCWNSALFSTRALTCTRRWRILTPTTGEYTSPAIPGEVKNIIFNEHHSVLANVRMEGW